MISTLPEATIDCVTVDTVDQLAEGSNRERWVTVSLHRKRYFTGWLVRTDVQERYNQQGWWNPKQHHFYFVFASTLPDSELLSYHVHHHMWNLELCCCSLFPEQRDNKEMVEERFSILDILGSPKILGQKLMIFEVTQSRTKQQNNAVYSQLSNINILLRYLF